MRPLLGGTSAPRFTYGLVKVKSRTATITLKDQEGNILADKDPMDPTDQSMRTIGPSAPAKSLRAVAARCGSSALNRKPIAACLGSPWWGYSGTLPKPRPHAFSA